MGKLKLLQIENFCCWYGQRKTGAEKVRLCWRDV